MTPVVVLGTVKAITSLPPRYDSECVGSSMGLTSTPRSLCDTTGQSRYTDNAYSARTALDGGVVPFIEFS